MDAGDARQRLEAAGFNVTNQSRIGDHGTRIDLSSGQVVNLWDKGTFNIQGSNPGTVQAILDGPAAAADPAALDITKSVFVVYGHDYAAKIELEAVLRRWQLEPPFLDQLPSEGKTVIEKLEQYTGQCGFAVVLATPDDEGHVRGEPKKSTPRARQNVVLELVMMLKQLGRDRVAILLRTQDPMERPSDIEGLIYIPYKDRIEEAEPKLAKEMLNKGLKPVYP